MDTNMASLRQKLLKLAKQNGEVRKLLIKEATSKVASQKFDFRTKFRVQIKTWREPMEGFDHEPHEITGYLINSDFDWLLPFSMDYLPWNDSDPFEDLRVEGILQRKREPFYQIFIFLHENGMLENR